MAKDKTAIEVCEMYLEQKKELAVCRNALKMVKEHMEYVAGDGHEMSSVWHLVNNALKHKEQGNGQDESRRALVRTGHGVHRDSGETE